MNNFEKICREIWKDETDNGVIIAKKKIMEHCNNDRNKYINLKAETNGTDFYSFAALITAFVALLFSDIALLFSFGNIVPLEIKGIMFAVAGCYAIYSMAKIVKMQSVNKWKCYFVMAFEELEKEKYGKELRKKKVNNR